VLIRNSQIYEVGYTTVSHHLTLNDESFPIQTHAPESITVFSHTASIIKIHQKLKSLT